MRIGIIGAGNIGGGCAHRFTAAGHDVKLSFARDPATLAALALELGDTATTGTPAEAVGFGEVVLLSVPWPMIDEALTQAGSLAGKIVIDTTNQFGAAPTMPPTGQTAASFNAARMPGARYTKSFNTLTAQFQQLAAQRPLEQRVVQWLCGDDPDANSVVAELISQAGYLPVDLGGTAGCAVMEAPRRAGSVYGEEYRAGDVAPVLDALAAGRPIPTPPTYSEVTS